MQIKIKDLRLDHIWDFLAQTDDPWELCGRYVDAGEAPPYCAVRRLKAPDGRATERQRRIVKAARRTALTVAREARGEVYRIRAIKQALRRGNQQMRLPFEATSSEGKL